jgi:hypothetical protein
LNLFLRGVWIATGVVLFTVAYAESSSVDGQLTGLANKVKMKTAWQGSAGGRLKPDDIKHIFEKFGKGFPCTTSRFFNSKPFS